MSYNLLVPYHEALANRVFEEEKEVDRISCDLERKVFRASQKEEESDADMTETRRELVSLED